MSGMDKMVTGVIHDDPGNPTTHVQFISSMSIITPLRLTSGLTE